METLNGYNRALTADELAGLLAIPTKTVYRMAKRGDLPSFKVGNCLRFCGPSVAQAL